RGASDECRARALRTTRAVDPRALDVRRCCIARRARDPRRDGGGRRDLEDRARHEGHRVVPRERCRDRCGAPAGDRIVTVPRLPFRTRAEMFLRLLAVQGAWNYETLMGNGVAFAVEPALRLLPGGRDGEHYRAAMARQCGYFNANPYLAGLAVGALASAELSGEPTERIERFHTACCG